MPKAQKQKKMPANVNERRDREVVLDALQNATPPEVIKKKKATISLVAMPHQRDGLVGDITRQQVMPKKEKDAATISLKDQKVTKVLKKAKHRDPYWAKTIPFFVFIFILSSICFLQTGLYRDSRIRPLSERIASAIHYPVAVVGARLITFTDFKSERDLLDTYTEKGFLFASDDATVKILAMNKIIRDTYINIGEKEFDVTVSDSSIEKAFVNLFGTQSDSHDAFVIANLTLSLTPEEIKQQIIKPNIEKLELSKKLLADPDLIQQQKKVAEQLKITFSNDPDSFSDQSVHPYLGVTFSDLGYLQTSSLAGNYSSLADLEIGGISEVFEDTQAFLIFRVTEKLPQDSESQQQYVSLQKIEIKKIDADLWIDAKLRSARVAIFDSTLSWNDSCLQVTQGDSCLSKTIQNSSVSLDSLYEVLTGDSSIFLPDFSTS